MCTERSAVAQQILSLFGIDTYYCMGCVEKNGKQEAHCFNVTKGKDGYILLDYSIPAAKFNENGQLTGYNPFLGRMSDSDFEEFKNNKSIKSFDDYRQVNGKVEVTGKRSYVVGKYEIDKTYETNLSK